MEKGKKYLVVYFDGSRERAKDLLFLKKEGVFLVFHNDTNGKEEWINEEGIIRMEEQKDEGRNRV